MATIAPAAPAPTTTPVAQTTATAPTTQPKAGDVSTMTGGAPTTPTTPTIPQGTVSGVAPTITPETLSTPPVAKVTPPSTDTSVTKGLSDIGTGADQFAQNLQTQVTTTGTDAKTSLQAYIDNLTNAPTQAGLQSTEYAKGGDQSVNALNKQLTDINNQILAERNSLQHAKDKINQEGGGLQSGAQAEISNLERDSLSKQADLAVIQQGMQGQYNIAKTIADRSVDAQMQHQKNVNDALLATYNENKSLFTTAEQRQFEVALADRNRALDEQTQNLKDIKSFALQAQQAGAPANVVQQMLGAKTMAEAEKIGGSYVSRSGELAYQQKQAELSKTRQGTKTDTYTTQSVITNPSLISSLTPTQQGTIIENLSDPTPPDWFVTQYEKENNIDPTKMSVDTSMIKSAWDSSRNSVLSSIGKTPKIKYTQTQQNSLIGAGFSSSDIPQIEQYVNQYGLQAFLDNNKNKMTADQITALGNIYGVTM